jgi:hypothetical protein
MSGRDRFNNFKNGSLAEEAAEARKDEASQKRAARAERRRAKFKIV